MRYSEFYLGLREELEMLEFQCPACLGVSELMRQSLLNRLMYWARPYLFQSYTTRTALAGDANFQLRRKGPKVGQNFDAFPLQDKLRLKTELENATESAPKVCLDSKYRLGWYHININTLQSGCTAKFKALEPATTPSGINNSGIWCMLCKTWYAAKVY